MDPADFRGRRDPLFAFFASRLELQTRYDALLPDDEPSVEDAQTCPSAHVDRADGADRPRRRGPCDAPRARGRARSSTSALGSRLRRAQERGFIADADWTRVAELLPPESLAPFGMADLPLELAGTFTEKDGTRGALVFVEGEPTANDDLRYLLRYADSFRETRLASGKLVRGSGNAVIFADMLKAVVRDIPKAVSLSLLLTLVAVLVTFRRGAQPFVVLFALLVGSAGVAAFLYLGRVRLNFLNFAALPITFGIGVDYAVNVAQRYDADGGAGIRRGAPLDDGRVRAARGGKRRMGRRAARAGDAAREGVPPVPLRLRRLLDRPRSAVRRSRRKARPSAGPPRVRVQAPTRTR